MSSSNALWSVLTIVSVVIGLATYIGAYLSAFAWRRRSTTASNYVLAGVSILVFQWLVALFVPMLAVQMVGAASMASVMFGMQLLSAITFAIGLGFLIAAAFVDRQPVPLAQQKDVYLPGDQKGPSSEANPYAASEPR